MRAEWPLVGRAAELEEVLRRLERGAGGAVLAGPAGAGKTRLAAECLEEASLRGFAAVRVAANQVTSALPFGAFAALLPELSPGVDRVEVLRQVAAAITERGKGRPVALLVDDAHLLDDTSAALTHQLAAGGRAFVLVTLRSGEPAPDPILALWKDGLADRLELQPLTETEVDDLLTVVLGGPVDGATRHLLYQRSSGNVLFLRELVLGALEAGVLASEGSLWRLHARLPASARLAELVEARLAGLSRREREGLEVLAVGEPIGVDLFTGIIGEASLTALERRRLVQAERDGRRLEIRLTHPLHGEVLRALLSPVRTRALSRSLADTLEAAGARRREDLLRLATWRLDGGGDAEPVTMLAAARRAWALHDLVLAEQLARAALSAGGGFDAALLIAQVLSLTGRADEAERSLAALLPEAADDTQRGQLAIARVDNLCFSLGRLDDALRVAEEAESTITSPSWRDEVTAYRASILDVSGQTAAALAVSAPLLERTSGRALVWACVMATREYANVGQVERAVAVSQQGLAAYRALTGHPMPWSPSVLVSLGSWALAYGGQLAEAEETALAEYERGVQEGSAETLWLTGSVLCAIHLMQGRVSTAVHRGREAAMVARDAGRSIVLRVGLIPLAEALALVGQPEEAEAVLAELDSPPMSSFRVLEAELARARAWTAVARNDLAEARRLLRQAIATATASGERVSEAAAWHDLARLGEAAAAVSPLTELAALVDGPLIDARAAHARALAARDGTGLTAASNAFEALGAVLFAAEAAADAATAWRRGGETRKAGAAQRRAAQLTALCEGAETPSLRVAVDARAILSGRELEIARLALAGRSNKEIAQQLCLSVKTIENKLHVAYEKLGVGGRDELAGALDAP